MKKLLETLYITTPESYLFDWSSDVGSSDLPSAVQKRPVFQSHW